MFRFNFRRLKSRIKQIRLKLLHFKSEPPRIKLKRYDSDSKTPQAEIGTSEFNSEISQEDSEISQFGSDTPEAGLRSSLRRLLNLRNKDPRTLWIIGGVTAAIVVIMLGYASSYTSQPAFCIKCHEMEPAYNAWKVSVHAEVDCSNCHYNGLFGFFKQKTALMSDIVKHISKNYSIPINADSALSKDISGANCLVCHSPKRVVTPKHTLVMNHNIHLEKGINCTTCHNRVGHPVSAGYKTYMSMQGCFRCHGLSDAAIAPGRCNACHPKSLDLVPAGGPLNHKTDKWLHGNHGRYALQDISPCMMCHQKSFCRGCHGVEVPHPEKFKKEQHGAIGSKNPEICQKCHRQQDFCNACHHRGYNGPPGGWIPTHKFVVAQVGPSYCFGCHGPTFCAWCHVRGEKQPRTSRQQADKELQQQ